MSLPFPTGYYRAEAKYADVLRQVGLPDAMSVFEHPKIEVWRSITERENCVLDYDGGRLHIKRNKLKHRGVEEEADAIRLLMTAGIGTVPLVAAGRLNDGRGFLITDDLTGFEDADVAVRNGLPFERVLTATAEMAGRLHAAGLHHRDLYLCHFYVAATPDAAVEARLMDAGRVKPLPTWFRRRWLVKDVAQLVYSLRQLNVSQSQIDEWLTRYTAAGGATVDAAFRRAVDRKATAIGRHDAQLRRRQPTRNVSINR
jgi:hypothetical protein